ncbi:hypothetical protein CP985_14105 [Malaciobacter mytili LMG 24559]|uniref:Uncharacterized protein n=1 Tax=Malaciobacter mytili LMG 24559 TaxID=1032238 RepID=A0AAX2AFS3_9BACT|nr:hypothetical protein [Malaciobacter mytili]AXH16483.1 hypothetical protein AMYT_a0185 [Malaciobacter mytili LMG 24559]RXK12880.1 hypothetical protein CP985_14105 [Malaciobacter mytili LMG 24559]
MKKTEAKKIAQLYIASQLLLRDGFQSENLTREESYKVDDEIKKIANNLIKNFNLESLPVTSNECVEFVQQNMK